MYNFKFNVNTAAANFEQELDLLLAIKSTLPRYLNSMPNEEFAYVAKLLSIKCNELKQRDEKPILVETGCGASTIPLVYYANKFSGNAYTWDINVLKISELRRVLNETIGLIYKTNINDSWVAVQHFSTSRTLGINIMKEFNKKIDLFLHDSEHTNSNLINELNFAIECRNNSMYVLIDDAHYKFKNYDYAYANIMREKIGLSSVAIPENELGKTLSESAENFFKSKNIKYDFLMDFLKDNVLNDKLAGQDNLDLTSYLSGNLKTKIRFAAFKIYDN